jgi:8-hydroxy-5-deazaflavin:NADPH oxidoreductase
MTTAIIGTGGIGSAIARQLASGGETLRLSSADHESARALTGAGRASSTRPTTTAPARKRSG